MISKNCSDQGVIQFFSVHSWFTWFPKQCSSIVDAHAFRSVVWIHTLWVMYVSERFIWHYRWHNQQLVTYDFCCAYQKSMSAPQRRSPYFGVYIIHQIKWFIPTILFGETHCNCVLYRSIIVAHLVKHPAMKLEHLLTIYSKIFVTNDYYTKHSNLFGKGYAFW